MDYVELIALFDALMADGKTEDAGKFLKAALLNAKELEDKSVELTIQNEMVGYCRQARDKKGGLLAVTEALSLLKELGLENTVEGGTVFLNCGTALASFNDLDKALECFDKAVLCYEGALAPKDKLFAALYNNSSAAYELKGEYDKAEKLCNKALDILFYNGELMDTAVTYVNLARLYVRQGKTDENVLNMYKKAMECFDDPKAVWDTYYAHTCRKCAGAFEEFGLKAEADELMSRVHEVMNALMNEEEE